jgi:hypothetical protein
MKNLRALWTDTEVSFNEASTYATYHVCQMKGKANGKATQKAG